MTRNEFLTLVGTVNADIRVVRGTLRYETGYLLVAGRIAHLARTAGLRVLHTAVPMPGREYLNTEIVTIKGFAKGPQS